MYFENVQIIIWGQSMKQDGIDAQMQAYFPEGYFFTNVLAALSLQNKLLLP